MAVADSWIRSAAAGVDPDRQLAPVVLDDDDLVEYRAAHPLSAVFPLLYDVLGRVAEDCDYVMAVGDSEGRLLWVCGPRTVLRRVESINFVEGAAWDEAHAGTNAPGMALATGDAAVVRTAEHFTRMVQPWSCAAAPIHDPATHEILGVVDVTGGEDVAAPQTLGLVRAAARMAESELARLALQSRLPAATLWTPPAPVPHAAIEVHGLGRPDCLLRIGQRTNRLSRRHSEILVGLTEVPEGMTAEQLELEVYAGDVHSSTMRAEMARLRTLLGADLLRSRPYRLTCEMWTDWRDVSAHLAAQRVGDALRAYCGPLLPGSEAPAVVRLRDRLDRALRAAILNSGKSDLMVGWTRSRWGADDLEMWQQQAELLSSRSPLRAIAIAEAARLERELRVF